MWNRWRYHYPQRRFPYEDLIDRNGQRSRLEPEYELIDTGVFAEDRYWITEVHYAKAGPDDILMTIDVTNAGPDEAQLHVLPTAWFRNTWSWDARRGPDRRAGRPELAAAGVARVTLTHPFVGPMELIAADGPDGAPPDDAVLRERNQRRQAVRRRGADPVP